MTCPRPEPFPFRDFCRARDAIEQAVRDRRDPFILLTGPTGAGKTALLHDLRSRLDRCRFRVVYFTDAPRLGPAGVTRVLARSLRLPLRRSHSETLRQIIDHLAAEPTALCLWIDDAHDLPAETFGELRALVEGRLGAPPLAQVLLSGMPPLRERLVQRPDLWRRLVSREEITGLVSEEMEAFLEHHAGSDAQRLCPDGQSVLFEQARGLPGFILPMLRTLLRSRSDGDPIDPLHVEETLARWDLP